MMIFDHIPKTGGSTFCYSYLGVAFHPDELFIVRNHDRDSEHERFRTMTHEERRRLRVVAGHYMEFAREIEPQATFLTIVRDPVQRVISSYLHAIYDDAMRFWRDQSPQLPSLYAYAKHADDDFNNLQSAILLGDKEQSLTDEDVERRITSRFEIVGITEDYNRLMFYLHRLCGFPLCLFNKQLVRKERSLLQIDPLAVHTIEEKNSMDVRTYGIACRMFDARFSAMMSPTDWEIYHLYERCQELFSAVTRYNGNSHVCLTRDLISLCDIAEYKNLLDRIVAGGANYSDLLAKSAMRAQSAS